MNLPHSVLEGDITVHMIAEKVEHARSLTDIQCDHWWYSRHTHIVHKQQHIKSSRAYSQIVATHRHGSVMSRPMAEWLRLRHSAWPCSLQSGDRQGSPAWPFHHPQHGLQSREDIKCWQFARMKPCTPYGMLSIIRIFKWCCFWAYRESAACYNLAEINRNNLLCKCMLCKTPSISNIDSCLQECHILIHRASLVALV